MNVLNLVQNLLMVSDPSSGGPLVFQTVCSGRRVTGWGHDSRAPSRRWRAESQSLRALYCMAGSSKPNCLGSFDIL